MEIKITKKTFIYIGTIVVLCCASFCTGRFLRFKGISGSSEQLISGIILSRDEVDSIADRLNVARTSIGSADDLQRAVSDGVGKLQRGNEVGQLCIDAIEQSIKNNQKRTEELEQSYNDFSDATDRALELVIIRSEEYERLIRSFQQIIDNNAEDAGVGESRP